MSVAASVSGVDDPPFELVLVGASADGLAAIGHLIAGLPADFPVPVAVVLHRGSSHEDVLPRILSRRTPLRVKLATEGEAFHPGTVYVAPATCHLVVRPNRTFRYMDGRRIRHLRSAANPLFESSAYALEGRVIAVILTGSGTDGTEGALAVKGMGGFVIAQDPSRSAHPSMPHSAIESGAVDVVLPLSEIPDALVALTLGRAEKAG